MMVTLLIASATPASFSGTDKASRRPVQERAGRGRGVHRTGRRGVGTDLAPNRRMAETSRERLLEQGALALSETELLAVVLGSGTSGLPARAIAESLLALGPGLLELSR